MKKLSRIVSALKKDPNLLGNLKKTVFWSEAVSYCKKKFKNNFSFDGPKESSEVSPLEIYFESHLEGPGIWKWLHYFDVYHRHLAKFIGKRINIVEVGIYSGGSLGMWKEYFGPQCHIYGIDIEPACKCYEDNQTTVLIGDQEDRNFWKKALQHIPPIDILIDDGGHMPNQQIVTLEETLPYINPGGVYICEDIHGDDNSFSAYATGYVGELNKFAPENLTPYQRAIHSIHFYPFMAVIEKHRLAPEKFSAPKHGTQWQPFFK